MSPRVRVIGIGQPTAGDDGVGLVITSLLRALGVPEGVEVVDVREPSALLPLLTPPARVILLDAILGVPVGRVLKLSLDELEAQRAAAVSTHGLGVAATLRLAKSIDPAFDDGRIEIVAVCIARPRQYSSGLSSEISSAAQSAAHLVRSALVGR